jgi:hypothetical protein
VDIPATTESSQGELAHDSSSNGTAVASAGGTHALSGRANRRLCRCRPAGAPDERHPATFQAQYSGQPRLRHRFQALREQFEEYRAPGYPRELNARVTIYTKDQRALVKEQLGYEGGLTNPMSWDRTVEKFQWQSESFADQDLRSRLIEAVQQLDERPISELMILLSEVRTAAVFPATHPGIQ